MPPQQTINLWPDDCKHNQCGPNERPALWHYPCTEGKTTQPRAAVIVCPGGGYTGLANHEGEPFAQLFAAHGMVAFVLRYRRAPNFFPAPQTDATRALRLIRNRADELGVDPNRLALMGFSAGGHLAASVGVMPHLHVDEHDDLAAEHSARPDRLILGYPVVSMLWDHHVGSMRNLLGEDAPRGIRQQLSPELHVTADSPPAFIFQTASDPSVLASNSLRLALAYAQAGVLCEYHQFERGRHGVGLALDDPKLCGWSQLLLNWLADWAK